MLRTILPLVLLGFALAGPVTAQQLPPGLENGVVRTQPSGELNPWSKPSEPGGIIKVPDISFLFDRGLDRIERTGADVAHAVMILALSLFTFAAVTAAYLIASRKRT